MIYLEPFAGHAEIRAYFDKVVSIVPSDLKFVVEDITEGDPRKVGVKWCATFTLTSAGDRLTWGPTTAWLGQQ
jgi:hypothetical protein